MKKNNLDLEKENSFILWTQILRFTDETNGSYKDEKILFALVLKQMLAMQSVEYTKNDTKNCIVKVSGAATTYNKAKENRILTAHR